MGDRMASITGQLKAQDTAFADLLNIGGPALDEGRALFDRVAPALPVLLANLVSLGEIAVTYRSDIEQLLVLFPQGTAVMSAIVAANANTKQDYKGVYLDFNLNLNLPPPCNTGFLPVRQQRSPSDVDYPERPAGELYCRVPQDSQSQCPWRAQHSVRDQPRQAGADGRDVRKQRGVRPAQRRLQLEGRPERDAVRSGCAAVRAGRPTRGNSPRRRHRCAAVPYDPATGDYIGPDGKRYTQADLAPPAEQDLAVDAGPARRRSARYGRAMAVSDSREVVIEATPEEILDVIADVETAPDWSSQHQGCRDSRHRRGRQARQVKLKLKTMGIADEQVVQYTWTDHKAGWTLISLESAQDAGREVTR